jgi:hypothetical protein
MVAGSRVELSCIVAALSLAVRAIRGIGLVWLLTNLRMGLEDMTSFKRICVAGLMLTAWLAELSSVAAEDLTTAAEMAEQIAAKVHQVIMTKAGSNQQFRVAVFPCGDADNRVTLEMGAESMSIQGELVFQLRKQASGKYFVLDKAGLSREFKNAGVDPSSVNPGNQTETAKTLKDIGVDAAVVSAMQDTTNDLVKLAADSQPATAAKKVPVAASVIFKDGSFDQSAAGSFSAGTLPDKQKDPSGRFGVEMIVDGRVIEFAKGDDPTGVESRFHNVLFAVLKESDKGKEYVLKIKNNGKPNTRTRNEDAELNSKRVYAVAVKIDGVNSIYQNTGNGEVGPVMVSSENCRKWLLSSPGFVVDKDQTGQLIVRLKTNNDVGDDHSIRPIAGYQKDLTTAAAFVLASPGDSIAETIGTTKELGLIEISFYAQKFNKDITTLGDVGRTKAGRDLANLVQEVKLELHPNPDEVWRIFYRYDGSDGTPKKLKPLITIAQP